MRRRRHKNYNSEQAKRRRLNLAECQRGNLAECQRGMMIQPFSKEAIWAACNFERSGVGHGYHLTEIHAWCTSALTARKFVGMGWPWNNYRLMLVMRAPFFSRIKPIDWRAP